MSSEPFFLEKDRAPAALSVTPGVFKGILPQLLYLQLPIMGTQLFPVAYIRALTQHLELEKAGTVIHRVRTFNDVNGELISQLVYDYADLLEGKNTLTIAELALLVNVGEDRVKRWVEYKGLTPMYMKKAVGDSRVFSVEHIREQFTWHMPEIDV